MNRSTILGAALAAVAMSACGSDERELVGYPPDPAPQVDVAPLPDLARGGEPFELRGPDGGLLLVYFGYTNCPDVCPATFAALSAALDELGDEAERVDVAMITVDPARDLDVLAGYVQGFVTDAHALGTADDAVLRRVADVFGAAYQVAPATGGTHEGDHGGSAVAHTDHLYAVDDTGALVITWTAGTGSDDLAADLDQLLDDA